GVADRGPARARREWGISGAAPARDSGMIALDQALCSQEIHMVRRFARDCIDIAGASALGPVTTPSYPPLLRPPRSIQWGPVRHRRWPSAYGHRLLADSPGASHERAPLAFIW